MSNYTHQPSNGQPHEGEFVHVGTPALQLIADTAAASFTIEEIFTLVDMLLTAAYEQERKAGVS